MIESVSKRERALFIAGIVVLLAIIYGRSLFNDFVFWDDPDLILDNPFIRGLTPQNVVHAFSTYDPDLYVPLTTVSYQVNYVLGGLQPFIYHLTNLLLHAGSSILVGWIALRLSGKKSIALVTALLFAVHPVNVETVAWVSARKDVLSGFFFLLSLGSFLRWRTDDDRRWYVLALASFLFGLLSKVSILGLPFLLLLSDWHASRKFTKNSLLSSLPFFLLSIVFGYVAVFGKLWGTSSLWVKFLVVMQLTAFSLWH
ncbi:MAG: phospholipid carrier-dependent glycosyltransferase, partial [Candidatus Peribacteraceae bacterium]|nr:phospholipid carrier-dependent glycosyltransferase [Candidatus Peribacteraceae bacterium]